jgi:hypothetical protein
MIVDRKACSLSLVVFVRSCMVIYRFGVEGVDLLFGDKLGFRTKNEWESGSIYISKSFGRTAVFASSEYICLNDKW